MVVIGIVTVFVGLSVFFGWQIHLGRVEEIKTFQRSFDGLMRWNQLDDAWMQRIIDAPFDWETEENPIIDAAYHQGVTAIAA
jgi:hypothetical protein